MVTFLRRVVKFLFGLGGLVVGLAVTTAVVVARMIINPPRQRLWASPSQLGLAYEEVQFPAQDGARLSGWFLPATDVQQRQGATIILVHGWLWNRLGNAAESAFDNLIGAAPVDLLRLAHTLHHEGFNVLMYDWRNHGQSAASPPFTFGVNEANDLLGALEYVSGRGDVNEACVGVIGFSAGANALLYTLPQTPQIKAAIAVQPTTPSVFADRFGRDVLGPLSPMTLPISKLIYRMAGGPDLDSVQPKTAASRGYPTPILYVQGEGDQWGHVDDVESLAAVTVSTEDMIVVDSSHRFGGYQYLIDHPDMAVNFLNAHLN